MSDSWVMEDRDEEINRHYGLLVEILLLVAILALACAAVFPRLLR